MLTVLKFDEIPLWGALVICFCGGLLLALIIWFLVVPRIRKSAIDGKV